MSRLEEDRSSQARFGPECDVVRGYQSYHRFAPHRKPCNRVTSWKQAPHGAVPASQGDEEGVLSRLREDTRFGPEYDVVRGYQSYH